MTLKERLNTIRVTKAEIAREAGISYQALYMFMNREIQPTISTAFKIKKALEVITGEVITLEDLFKEYEVSTK